MNTVKRLDEAVAVSGFSAYGVQVADLHVRFGEVVVLAGPNGSGKSTVSRAIVGDLAVATGSVRVLGADPGDGSQQSRIGFLVKDMETMGSLTSRDVLDICAAVRGCSTTYAMELADRLELDVDRPMSQLCRGQLRRLGIVQALMHKPDLIVLDDPMTELDHAGRRALPDLIRAAADRGAAVLVTMQSLDDAEDCADRIVQLGRGPVGSAMTVTEAPSTAPEPIPSEPRAEAVAPMWHSAFGVPATIAPAVGVRTVYWPLRRRRAERPASQERSVPAAHRASVAQLSGSAPP